MDEIPQPPAPRKKRRRRAAPDPSKPVKPRSMGRLAVEVWEHLEKTPEVEELPPEFRSRVAGMGRYVEIDFSAQPKTTDDALRALREGGYPPGEYRIIRIVVPEITVAQRQLNEVRIGGAS